MNSFYLIYEITSRCNNDCIYCYNVWKEKANYPKGELQVPEIKALFRNVLQSLPVDKILISGGEPLLYPQIYEVVSFFREHGIKVGLSTNGVLLNKQRIKYLLKRGISFFEISLDSIDVPMYYSLTKQTRFNNVLQAISQVSKIDVPLAISTVVTRKNYAVVGDVIDLAAGFSVDCILLNRFIAGGQGLCGQEGLQISESELSTVLETANKKAGKFQVPIHFTNPIMPCNIDHQKYPNLVFGNSRCGLNKWVIDPVGNLRLCESSSDILGNLFDYTFSELSQLDAVKRFRDTQMKEVCEKCNHFADCKGENNFLF